jgi:NosR/NirI family nitrous oxide reductase transcriptional regulator
MTLPPGFGRVRAGGFLVALAVASGAGAATYEAPLSAQISTDPNLCAYVPCREVLTAADSFSLRRGRPAYVEGYRTRNDKRSMAGYVWLSTDVVDIPGYSGQPLVMLVGMDTRGVITGVRMIRHSESIVLAGLPEAALDRFAQQYVGRYVGDRNEIGTPGADGGAVGIDAISGATVTAMLEHETILRSAREIARQVGILPARAVAPLRFARLDETLDWRALLKEGAVVRLTVAPADVGTEQGAEPLIDLYLGYLNAPVVGRSVLGEDGYRRLVADLKPDEHAIFVIARGTLSFKGSGFARGGVFERIRIVQDTDAFIFRDTDYLSLPRMKAFGAPEYRESGIFILRSRHFAAACPWRFELLVSWHDRVGAARTFASFGTEYRLPHRYVEGDGSVCARNASEQRGAIN